MSEVYSAPRSSGYISAKKIREMKKKALQSYKKIATIKQKSDKEKNASSEEADRIIQRLNQQ